MEKDLTLVLLIIFFFEFSMIIFRIITWHSEKEILLLKTSFLLKKQVSILIGAISLCGIRQQILVQAWALRCSENKIRDSKMNIKCIAKE